MPSLASAYVSEHVSRRRFLQVASLGAIGGVGGCLRLTESTADTPTSRPTDAPDTGTAPDATAAQSGTPSSSFDARESWTLDKYGSDIVTYDGTFYLSTWVSKQLRGATRRNDRVGDRPTREVQARLAVGDRVDDFRTRVRRPTHRGRAVERDTAVELHRRTVRFLDHEAAGHGPVRHLRQSG